MTVRVAPKDYIAAIAVPLWLPVEVIYWSVSIALVSMHNLPTKNNNIGLRLKTIPEFPFKNSCLRV